MSSQTRFDEALQLLSEKRLNEGIALLEKIRKEDGLTSAGLEANLGKAYSQNGLTAKSLEHFERAIVLDRFQSTHRQDLKLAQMKVGEGLGRPMSHPSEWAWTLKSYIRGGEALSLALVFLFVFLSLRFFRPKLKKAAWISLGLFGFLLAMATFTQYSGSVAWLSEEAKLRSAPLSSAEEIREIPRGTRLRVLRSSGDFSEVERSGSIRGWIEKGKIHRSEL